MLAKQVQHYMNYGETTSQLCEGRQRIQFQDILILLARA